MDVGISVIPVDVDPLSALDKVFARLREIVAREASDVEYFTVMCGWPPAQRRDGLTPEVVLPPLWKAIAETSVR